MRLDMAGQLGSVRRRLASMVGAGPDEIVIVPSALHGVDTVLRNFEWNEGDVIIGSQSFPIQLKAASESGTNVDCYIVARHSDHNLQRRRTLYPIYS